MRLASTEAVGRILGRYHHDSSSNSTSSSSYSSEMSTEMYLTSLQDTVSDTDWMVRSASIDALSRIRVCDKISVALFRRGLGDDIEYVRLSAVHALGGRGRGGVRRKGKEWSRRNNKNIISSHIYNILNSFAPVLLLLLLLSLGRVYQQLPYRDDTIVSSLQECMNDPNKRVAMVAARTLHALHYSDKQSKAILHSNRLKDHNYLNTLTAKDIKSSAALRNAAVKDINRDMRYVNRVVGFQKYYKNKNNLTSLIPLSSLSASSVRSITTPSSYQDCLPPRLWGALWGRICLPLRPSDET